MNQQLVDIITQRVLQQLDGTHPSMPAAVDAALVIDQPVVTEDTMSRLVQDGRPVQFGEGTVLTPSARDFLRRRNIRWTRGQLRTGSTAHWRAIIVDHSPVLHSAFGSRQSVTISSASDSASGISEAVSEICRASVAGVVLSVTQPHRAACLANRNRRVRAVAVVNSQNIDDIVADVMPNLVCFNPQRLSVIDVRRIVRAVTTTAKAGTDWQEVV